MCIMQPHHRVCRMVWLHDTHDRIAFYNVILRQSQSHQASSTCMSMLESHTTVARHERLPVCMQRQQPGAAHSPSLLLGLMPAARSLPPSQLCQSLTAALALWEHTPANVQQVSVHLMI